MPNQDELRRILELWESGIPKDRIAEVMGLSRYSVRNCIHEYSSLAQFDALFNQAQSPKTPPRESADLTQRKYIITSFKRGSSAYTDEDLIKEVPEASSIAKLLEKFGLKPAGGNYTLINSRIKELGLDTSHFKGSHDWARGKGSSFIRQRALEEILVQDSAYTTSKLRKRLITEGIFEHRCVSCGLDTWLDNKIPLEIDHINGDRRDNRLENLRLLCPNCHALTSTYRGKNKKTATGI